MSKRSKKTSGKRTAVETDTQQSQPSTTVISYNINGDGWSSFPVILHCNEHYSRKYATMAIDAAREGTRRRFFVATWDEIEDIAREVVKNKGKGKDQSQALVLEACATALENNTLTAKGAANIIAAKIMATKMIEVQRREESSAAAGMGLQPEDGNLSKTPKPTKKKGKQNAAAAEDIPGKKKTTLKTRKEEALQVDYIDDEPRDGPDHYWLLHGFDTHPEFVSHMSTMGANIQCILSLMTPDDNDTNNDGIPNFENKETTPEINEISISYEDNGPSTNSSNSKSTKPTKPAPLTEAKINVNKSADPGRNIEHANLGENQALVKSENFLKKTRQLCQEADAASDLHDIAWVDVDVGPAPERQTAFNQIVVAIFSTLEQKRNYNLYCDSLEICRFPQRVSPPRDVYDAFIARTPRSVLTVPTIVDFMLKQVEHTVASAYENSCATSSLNQESQSLQEQELTAENIDDAKVTNDESASVDSAQTNVPDPRLAHFLDNQLAVFSSNGNQRSLLSSPYSNPNLSACHPQEPVVVRYGDVITYQFAKYAFQSSEHDAQANFAFRAAHKILKSSRAARLLNDRFPLLSRQELDAIEMRRQQLYKFSNFSPKETMRHSLLTRFEEVLSDITGTGEDSWDLSAWNISERLDHNMLLQWLNRDIHSTRVQPHVIYSQDDDCLLVVINFCPKLEETLPSFSWHHLAHTRVAFTDYHEHSCFHLDENKKQCTEMYGSRKASMASEGKGRHVVLSAASSAQHSQQPRTDDPRNNNEKIKVGSRRESLAPCLSGGSPTEQGSLSRLMSREGKENLPNSAHSSQLRGNSNKSMAAYTKRIGYDFDRYLISASGRSALFLPGDETAVHISKMGLVHSTPQQQWTLIIEDEMSSENTFLNICQHEEKTPSLGNVSQSSSNSFSLVASVGGVLLSIPERFVTSLRTQGLSEWAPPAQSEVEQSTAQMETSRPESAINDAKNRKKDRPRSRRDGITNSTKPNKTRELELPQLDPTSTIDIDSQLKVELDAKASASTSPTDFVPKPVEELFRILLTSPHGHQIMLLPNGQISIQTPLMFGKGEASGSEKREVLRTITQSGHVVRRFSDGKMSVLCPDGTVFEHISSEVDWEVVSFDGTRTRVHGNNQTFTNVATNNGASSSSTKLEDDNSGANEESSQNATNIADEQVADRREVLVIHRISVPEHVPVQTREDNVILVGELDRDHGVEFSDGTRISTHWLSSTEKIIHVECLNIPRIEFRDNAGAVILFDGGTVAVIHHPIQGKVQLCSASRGLEMLLEASGQGYVFLRDKGMWDREQQRDRGSLECIKCWASKDTLSMHAFNFITGNYMSEGLFGNRFSIEDMHPLVESSDKSAVAPLSFQYPPRLYAVYRDGTGTRLCREKDVSQYVSYARSNPDIEIVETPIQDDHGTVSTTFIQKLQKITPFSESYSKESLLPLSLQRPQTTKKNIIPKEVLLIRQFQRHPILKSEDRHQFNECVSQYYDWLGTMNEVADTLDVEDLRHPAEKQLVDALTQEIICSLSTQSDERIVAGCKTLTTPPATPQATTTQRTTLDEFLAHDPDFSGNIDRMKSMLLTKQFPKYFETPEGKGIAESLRQHASDLTQLSKNVVDQDQLKIFHKSQAEVSDGSISNVNEQGSAQSNDSGDENSGSKVQQHFYISAKPKSRASHCEDGREISLQEFPQSKRIMNDSLDLSTNACDPLVQTQPLEQGPTVTAVSAKSTRESFGDDSSSVFSDNGNDEMELNADLSQQRVQISSTSDVQSMAPQLDLIAQHDAALRESPEPLGPRRWQQQQRERRRRYSSENLSKLPIPSVPRGASDRTLGASAPEVDTKLHAGENTKKNAAKEQEPVVRILPEVRVRSAQTLGDDALRELKDAKLRQTVADVVPNDICRPNPLPAIGRSMKEAQKDYENIAHETQDVFIEIVPSLAEFGVLKSGCMYCLVLKLYNRGQRVCNVNVNPFPVSTGIEAHCLANQISPGMSVKLTLNLDTSKCLGPNDRRVLDEPLSVTCDQHELNIPITATVLSVKDFEAKKPAQRCRGPGVRLIAARTPYIDKI